MTDIDLTEASGAAYRGWREAATGRPLEQGEFSATWSRSEAAWMHAAVAAALPHIERQVREQVAREVEAEADLSDETCYRPKHTGGMRAAARIARGEV